MVGFAVEIINDEDNIFSPFRPEIGKKTKKAVHFRPYRFFDAILFQQGTQAIHRQFAESLPGRRTEIKIPGQSRRDDDFGRGKPLQFTVTLSNMSYPHL
jgi:hypothetical protein